MIWSDYGYGHKLGKGVIVGGCDAGRLLIYNAAELLNSEVIDYETLPRQEDGLIACLNAHSGPVRALDFNAFQVCLFISC